jgi:patatin-related protein
MSAVPSPTAQEPQTVPAPSLDLKELRLGLVCYGGVSLAIYMHGMTKEIHRAIRASIFEERALPSAGGASSEQAYRELIRALAEERGVQTRIVVDAIAGSSAGGINGIFLGKALAHNLNQDTLRDLWFERGDLEAITRKGGRLVRVLTRFLPVGDGVPSRRARRKLVAAALGVHKDSVLYGHQMSNWIWEALEGMEARPEGSDEPPSLMPERHELELAVTVTDHYGYRRDVPITDPGVVAEGQHRHLLEFSFRSDDSDHFDREENGALALAARATSSLPAGFPVVNLEEFAAVLPPGATTPDRLSRFFRAYRLSGADPTWAYLVDGGVLDNKPFGPVIRAIKERHASNEVDRYLAFLEPDPGSPSRPKERPKSPPPLRAVLGALSGLPRSEPILDELQELLLRNERVRAVRDVIESNWSTVENRVRELIPGLDDPPADPGSPQLKEWSETIHRAARELGGLGYGTYLRLKIGSALDSFARAACLVCDYTDSSNHAQLVRDLVRAWARGKNLFAHDETEEQRAFVRDFDLRYAERRLRFVIAGVSWLYRDAAPEMKDGYPSRRQLDAVKERLYEALAKLEWLSSGRGFAGEVLGGVQTCFGEQRLTEYLRTHGLSVDRFLTDHGDELDAVNDALRSLLDQELEGFTAALYSDLIELTAGWDTKTRRDLLIRYLGFPIWDGVLYPVQALSDVAERDEIRVLRLSPRDSSLLKPLSGRPKVQGADLGHAYAFFSREARENDYLWGRLDAAERLVRLLLTRMEVVGEGDRKIDRRVPGQDHPDYRARCQRVFRAVLEEDAPHLPNVRPLVDDLRRQIDALA